MQNNQNNQNRQSNQNTQYGQNNPYNQQGQYQGASNQQYQGYRNQEHQQGQYQGARNQQYSQQYNQPSSSYNQYYAKAQDVPVDQVPQQFRPIGIWGHVGYFLLFGIPVIGLIFALILSFNDSNYARRNLARAMAIVGAVTLVLGILNLTTGFTLFGIADYTGWRDMIEEIARQAN